MSTSLQALQGKRILVAEDDFANQKVARLFLRKIGCVAELAENGQQAVELAGCNDYDLILMDCQMPIMDGLEATRKIRSTESGRVPIIAMTANIDGRDRERCFDAGMDDFVSKPVNLEQLKDSMVRCLQSLD